MSAAPDCLAPTPGDLPPPAERGELVYMSVDDIEPQPGFNPRRFFCPVRYAELRDDIRERGEVTEALQVRPRPDTEGKVWIVAGERRWRAAKECGLAVVPCIVRVLSDEEALALADVENRFRDGISAAEEAFSAQRMLRLTDGDRDEAAKSLRWSRKVFDARLQLTLATDEVLQALAERKIKLGHAELLSCLPAENQNATLPNIIDKDVSVEVLREKLSAHTNDLNRARFDTEGCRSCPHNTTRQATLFEQHVGDSRCTKPSCFQEKTVAFLQEQRVALRDAHNCVFLDTERDRNSWTILLKRDVGSQQFEEGCKQCKHFGCLVATTAGEAGKLTEEVCFDLSCHRSKCEAHQQEVAPPMTPASKGAATTTAKTKPASSSHQKRKPTAAAAAPPKRVMELVHAVHRRAAGVEVLRSVHMGQVIAILALLKELGLMHHVRDAHDPLTKRGIKRASGSDSRTPLIAALYALSPAALSDITTELASMVADREIGDFQSREQYLKGSQSVLRVLNANLSEHFVLGKEFLSAHTKSAIDSLLQQAQFPQWWNEKRNDPSAYRKLLERKHEEIVKDALASGFDFNGFVPPVLSADLS